jgi:transposase
MKLKIGIPLRLGHLPVVMDFLRRSQLFHVIDRAVREDPRSKVSTSECVAVLLCSIFSGAHDLWRVRERLALYDMKTIMQDPGFDLDEFPEERLAKALDNLQAANLDKMMTAIAVQVIEQFDLNTEFLGFDTTSLSFYGAYEEEGFAGMTVPAKTLTSGPRVTYGYSKNHRGDLKQILYGTLMSTDGIPLWGKALDGNQGDSVSAAHFFSQVHDIVADPRSVCCVADSKGWCARVLKVVLADGMRLLSRLPRTNGLHARLMEKPWKPTQTYTVPARRRHEDPDVYTFMAFDLDQEFSLVTPAADPQGDPIKESFSVPVRALRIHSTALQRTKVKTLKRTMARERIAAKKALTTWRSHGYTSDDDALRAAEQLRQNHGWVTLNLRAIPRRVTGPLKRGRGRPSKHSAAPLEGAHYRLDLSVVAVGRRTLEARLHAQSSYILIRTRSKGWNISDSELIPRYKGLYHNEHGFAWLKSGASLNPIFLHTPQRIGSLSFVYCLGLMTWNLIQRAVRTSLVKNNTGLPYHRGKLSNRITTRFLFYLFNQVQIVPYTLPDGTQQQSLVGLEQYPVEACRALGCNPKIYEPVVEKRKVKV